MMEKVLDVGFDFKHGGELFDEAFILERDGEVEEFGVGPNGVEECEEGEVFEGPVVAGETE